jgi:hypothetical protein
MNLVLMMLLNHQMQLILNYHIKNWKDHGLIFMQHIEINNSMEWYSSESNRKHNMLNYKYNIKPSLDMLSLY